MRQQGMRRRRPRASGVHRLPAPSPILSAMPLARPPPLPQAMLFHVFCNVYGVGKTMAAERLIGGLFGFLASISWRLKVGAASGRCKAVKQRRQERRCHASSSGRRHPGGRLGMASFVLLSNLPPHFFYHFRRARLTRSCWRAPCPASSTSLSTPPRWVGPRIGCLYDAVAACPSPRA